MGRAVKPGLYGCGNRTRTLLDSTDGEGLFEAAASCDSDDGSGDCRNIYHKCTGPDERIFSSSSETIRIMLSFTGSARNRKQNMSPCLEDGWRVSVFAEAIEESFKTGRR